ncbi:MAG: hypothetical protein RSG52_13140 [Terrisporobacter sp.]|uniref:hypothetical protein n=1 Tax=Terrisporobacter sp. TaxID=1965305 RepID=UPI002FC86CF8
MEGYINLTKTVSDSEIAVNDIITYKVKAVNTSQDRLRDIIIMDLLPDYCEFVSGSIMIDNKTKIDSNIISGVYLPTLAPAESKIIAFDVKIIQKPSKMSLSKSLAEYKVCDCDEKESRYSYSNTCELLIREPSLLITKVCDKEDALLNSILNFTIDIYNNGELDLLNLFMIEDIPAVLEVLSGSFMINGIAVNNVDLKKGVSIGDIDKSSHLNIRYSLKVVSSSLKSRLECGTEINYKYLASNNTLRTKECKCVKSYLSIPISTFKSISIDNYFEIESGQFDIFEINDVKASAVATSYHIVKTPRSTSNEGQILSGYKLIVQGTVTQSLEYVSDYFNQGLKTSTFESIFSSYIILPKNFPIHSKLEVEPIIEDVYYYKIDSRRFFENVSMLLTVKISTGSEV